MVLVLSTKLLFFSLECTEVIALSDSVTETIYNTLGYMYNYVQRHPRTEWNVRRGFIHRRLSQNEHPHRKQAIYSKRPDLNSPTAGKQNGNPSRI